MKYGWISTSAIIVLVVLAGWLIQRKARSLGEEPIPDNKNRGQIERSGALKFQLQ